MGAARQDGECDGLNLLNYLLREALEQHWSRAVSIDSIHIRVNASQKRMSVELPLSIKILLVVKSATIMLTIKVSSCSKGPIPCCLP